MRRITSFVEGHTRDANSRVIAPRYQPRKEIELAVAPELHILHPVLVIGDRDPAPVGQAEEMSELAAIAVRYGCDQPLPILACVQLDFGDEVPQIDDPQLLIPANIYCDTRLLIALMERTKATLLVDSDPPNELLPLLDKAQRGDAGFICGPAVLGDGQSETLDVADLDPYLSSSRREIHPLWFPAPAPQQVALAERLIFDSAQKGLLNFTAKLHWPFENFLVRSLWPTNVTPNQVTFFSFIIAGLTTIEFARGHWWIGAILSRIFAIIDGVDGKLARTKVETTEAGKYENHADIVIEYSWWFALSYSLGAAGQLTHAWLYSLLIIAGNLLGKVANRFVAKQRGMPSHRHSDFERWFRLVAGCSDIYTAMFLVGLLVGHPGPAFAAAGYWGIITAAIYWLRAICIRLFTSRRS
jgi:phosphatidylglycerophosphate synthase